jgi:competence protein ComEC
VPPIAVIPSLALLIGAALGSRLPIAPSAQWLLPLILLAAVAAWRCAHRRALVWLTGLGFALAAMLLAGDALTRTLASPLRAALDARYSHFTVDTLARGSTPEPILTRFDIVQDAAAIDDAVAMPVAVTAVQIDGKWQGIPRELVRLTIGGTVAPPRLAGWRAGRMAMAPVAFRRPASYFNDGVGDFERDLAIAGTTLFGSIKSGYLVDVEASGSVFEEAAATVRAHVRAAVTRHVGPRGPVAAAIVTAILIGDRTGLPDDVRLRLQAAGTYHIIAISGGNIALLAGVMLALLPLFLVRGRAAAAVTIVVLAGYACIVTAGPSVWRATVMAILYLGARVFDQRSPTWQAMAVACTALVVTSPLSVSDPGFLLTFGATAALLEGAPRLYALAQSHLSRILPSRLHGGAPRLLAAALSWVVASVMASVAVEIVLLPVAAQSFSRVTAAGVVLNLLAVPLMAVVQMAGMIVVAASRLGTVADLAGPLAALAANAIVDSARLVDAVPALSPRVPAPGPELIALYYAGLGVTLAVPRARTAAAILVVGVAGCMVAGVPVDAGRTSDVVDREARLTMLDVGQGESMLLELPGALPLLIDAAGAPFGSSGDQIGARVVAPALWRRGVRRLGALLVTHGDPDHIGGAMSVVHDFRPRQLWTGIQVPSHQPSQTLAIDARRAGAAPMELRRGMDLTWGRARIRVLHPPAPDWERQQVRNDDSVVLEVLFGDVALLLTGDISTAVEAEILPHLSRSTTRVLKVAHHGSRTSSSSLLLDRWRPQLALISCGRGNRFGHPTTEVLERLHAAGTRVYRTDLDGQTTLETDGRQLRVRTYMEGRDE